ncbi:MAG: MBL fold metallo-hydrolase [Chloroflexi bacterium]|jgi:alkyl sulfatase BDS1-like metallo-beta-lactamase superfamily hydrolase|nr:MBL fold metallo-hydrolase [Chloroflexota bacterium]
MAGPKPASPLTASANAAVRAALPFEDETDFDNARRGLIVEASGQIKADAGHVAWDFDRWAFLDGDAPPTANPSLWRQGQLNAIAGLFEVADGIYQARGFDLAVMSFLRTDGGWIVVDPLVTVEPARAAFDLVRRHVADLPVVAVIYTHSHADHFGGVRAVATDEDVAAGRVRIIAPVDFLEEAVSENVFLGNVMSRRASYMYGNLAGAGPDRGVGTGLAQVTSAGRFTVIPPTDIVSATGEEMTIDGLRIVFQHTPGAEAPAELCFFLPDRRALCMAEIASHTLHNVYTLRGAKIRDALAWSRHINDAIHLFGGETDVVFSSHHWPTWGNAEVIRFLKGQRDLYRYIHDETLRLANLGYGPAEIAEMVELPDGIARSFANRGYYGSVSHNVRAVYTYYLGFFDGNPATLNPLPPVEGARKAVEYMGGADAVLDRARADFERGEYRWVAQAVNYVVFADPGNVAARELQADTLEQLGYQAENGTWRNFYLSAAKELRDGVVVMPTPSTATPDPVRAMSVEMFLQYLAVRLNGPKAAGRVWAFDLQLRDVGERYLLEVENGVLNFTRDAAVEAPTATLTLERSAVDRLALGQATFAELVADGSIGVEGDTAALVDFFGLLDTFEFWFDIVTP